MKFVVPGKAIVFFNPSLAKTGDLLEDIVGDMSAEDVASFKAANRKNEVLVEEFAKVRKIPVYRTSARKVVFKKSYGGEYVLRNDNWGFVSQVYLFDEIHEPKLVKDVSGFSNGNEFNEYFFRKLGDK